MIRVTIIGLHLMTRLKMITLAGVLVFTLLDAQSGIMLRRRRAAGRPPPRGQENARVAAVLYADTRPVLGWQWRPEQG